LEQLGDAADAPTPEIDKTPDAATLDVVPAVDTRYDMVSTINLIRK
jgi:hypothetical protein